MTESLLGHVVDGRYRVLSHIADGGMASVYLALDTRLDRDIALKVLRRDLAQDAAFASRFRREARSAARLVPPQRRLRLRPGRGRRPHVPGHGVRAWPDAPRGDARRGAAHSASRTRHHGSGAPGARGRSSSRHHPSRRQAREHHPARGRRHREGRRLRARSRSERADHHLPDRRAPRHRGLPVSRAGRARDRRRPQRRLCRRADPLRDAHRHEGLHRRHAHPHRLPARPRLGPGPVLTGQLRAAGARRPGRAGHRPRPRPASQRRGRLPHRGPALAGHADPHRARPAPRGHPRRGGRREHRRGRADQRPALGRAPRHRRAPVCR